MTGKTAQKNKKLPNTVNAPAAKGTKTKKQTPPSVQYKNDGSCVINHLEYVGDIDALATDAQITYPCNPQSPTTFTWLSAVATRFEMFRFRKLKFHYRPSCSTSNEGYVVLGFDFDAYDEFPSKVVMLAWKYSTKSAVWQESTLDCTTDSRLSTFRYCGNGSAGDRRLDLLGNLFVLAKSTSALSVGEIFVSYEIEFRQPSYRVPPALSLIMRRPSDEPDMPSADTWWETALDTLNRINGNIDIQVIEDDKIVIKTPGKYLFDVLVDATGAVTNAPNISFQIPTSSPSSNFVVNTVSQFFNSTRAQSQYVLDVVTAPVQATFGGLAGGNNLKPTLRMSTYFAGL